MILAATVTVASQLINWTIESASVIVVLGIVFALNKIRLAFEVPTYTVFTITTITTLWTLIIARTKFHTLIKITVTL